MPGRAGSIILIVALILSLAGCESHRGRSPYETSMPSQYAGFRVTDGELSIWTGSPCLGATRIDLVFEPYEGTREELQLATQTYQGRLTPGVEVQYVTLGAPNPGFQVTTPLPPGYDWRSAQRLSFAIDGPPVSRGPSNIDFAPVVAEITENSARHPEDTYFFPDLGWLGPADIAAGNGVDFLTMCTPDPAKAESQERVAGVRVTDGSLRFWTGADCIGDTGVIVSFQPGQADLVLGRAETLSENLQNLTLGGPYPGFTVVHPLPDRFDWRAAQSVLLRMDFDGSLRWSRTTALATPIAESSRHPDDTYYFEGIGWLNPTQVAAQDGSSLRTICNDKR